jgi:PadR family transcriptional regulator, regulatory protein PadR
VRKKRLPSLLKLSRSNCGRGIPSRDERVEDGNSQEGYTTPPPGLPGGGAVFGLDFCRHGNFPVDIRTIEGASYSCWHSTGVAMAEGKSDVLQGTLDLMVLKTLETMGPLHGYGIARRIEQVSGDTLSLNQGTIYPALLRLEQRGWIRSEWGTSESNRRAKFYSLSRVGRKKIEQETENWERIASTMARFLASS